MVGMNNNNILTSEKMLSSDGSTRLTTISTILIRGGVVSSSLISVFYVIISLILANWALSFIPCIVLIPFFMFFSLDLEGIIIYPLQAFIFPPSYRPNIIERYLFYGNNVYIFRFLGLVVVIFTLFLLMFQLRDFIQEKSNLQQNFSSRLFQFELIFRLILIFLLAYEIILPLWDSLFPNALFSPSNYQEFILLIDTVITPPLTLLCLIFLLLGSFRHSYFVINNYDLLKKGWRKITTKINSADEVV